MRGGFSLRNLLFALALAAMGVRAAAPPGYMFSPGSTGLTVTLCNGGSFHLDLGGVGHDQNKHSNDSGTCLFAAAAHAAPAPTTPQPAAVSVASVAAQPAAPAVSIGRGLAAPPPPATGPPVIV
jgi:hypothetical protein